MYKFIMLFLFNISLISAAASSNTKDSAVDMDFLRKQEISALNIGLMTRISLPCVTLAGHTKAIYALHFNSDDTVTTASYDDTVKLWDAHAGKLLESYDGDMPVVQFGRFAYSPDEETKLVADGNKFIMDKKLHKNRVCLQIFDKLITILEGHTATIDGVLFNDDGSVVATMSRDGIIKLWRDYQADLKELKANRATRELLRVAHICWQNNKPHVLTQHEVDVVQKLIAHYPYFNDKRLFETEYLPKSNFLPDKQPWQSDYVDLSRIDGCDLCSW